MAVGQFTISGLVQGSPSPQLVLPPYYIPSPNSVPSITEVNLINGANTITITQDANNQVCILVPPNYAFPTPLTTFTGTLTLKGVTGDTGIPLDIVYPTLISISGTSSTFVIASTAAAVMTVVCA